MPHGVHGTSQTAFRFPAAVLARLKNSARRHGQTQTDIVVRGTVAELDRLDGIAANAPPPPVAARPGQPQPARRPVHSPTCKCGTCRPK